MKMKPRTRLIEKMREENFDFLYNVNPVWMAEDLVNKKIYFEGENGGLPKKLSTAQIKEKIAREMEVSPEDIMVFPMQYWERHFPRLNRFGLKYRLTREMATVFIRKNSSQKYSETNTGANYRPSKN